MAGTSSMTLLEARVSGMNCDRKYLARLTSRPKVSSARSRCPNLAMIASVFVLISRVSWRTCQHGDGGV